ncbi:MAG: 4-hydroxy-3-methylbut-2-enyl diphosphate reductase [Lachnospiraceae bacterium]|jgi:4-hydroxy-3-methylbut-2-enyl diphosphate reductase|nr:4-hydroxy-3-methylbut-2-enyl diphosphate reductase [Lachnospiraceae bacterium]
MPEVITAKTAGFCFGVKRAVKMVYDKAGGDSPSGLKTAGPIYTYGPIIHNEIVQKDLEARGVIVADTIKELEKLPSGTIIIRSHGITREEHERLLKSGHNVIDATCPFVKKIHRLVMEKSKEGYEIVILGDPKHPEVIGIKGWAGENVSIIENKEDAVDFLHKKTLNANESLVKKNKKIPKLPICVVSQTTFNSRKFKELVEIIEKTEYDTLVVNTICDATLKRQEEAERIANRVDAMLVIGDSHSSNTQKLYDICSNVCKTTYFIQTIEDLNLSQLRSVDTVGITAGASTPNKIIEEVQNNVRLDF